MATTDDRIGDDEVLLRRIPPSTEEVQTVTERVDSTLRATTWAMLTRRDETELSCSLLRITPPRKLLSELTHQGIDLTGWHVCRFLAFDVRAAGLEVEQTPTDRDPGHCSIFDINGESAGYPKKKARKLARRTHILTDEEIDILSQQ